jgi:hypothetical protein
MPTTTVRTSPLLCSLPEVVSAELVSLEAVELLELLESLELELQADRETSNRLTAKNTESFFFMMISSQYMMMLFLYGLMLQDEN